MNIKMPRTLQGQITSSLILALVIVGTAFVSNIAGVAQGDSVLTKIFLVFFGAIIALQVVPGLILIGAMIRGLTTLTRKEALKEANAKK
jgi:hypothetical protein